MKKKPNNLARKLFRTGKNNSSQASGQKSKIRALRAKTTKARNLDTASSASALPKTRMITRLKEKLTNISIFWLTVKFFTYLFLCISSLMLVIYGLAFFFIDAEFIEKQLVSQAQLQTGGKLEINNVEFDLNHGLTLEGLTFTPPSLDTQAPKETDSAMIRIDEVRLHYNLPAIFLGSLELNALELVKPQIEVTQVDEVFNFAGIIEYRKQHFPPVAKSPETAHETSPKPEGGGIFLPLHPKLLYLPFQLKIEKIGITDALLRFLQVKQGKTLLDLRNQGLNFNTSLFFKGNSSEFNIDLASPEDGTIDLAVYKASMDDEQISYSKPFVKLKSSFDTNLQVKDLTQIKLTMDQEIKELEGVFSHLQGLSSKVLFATRFTDDLKGVLIEDLMVDLGEVLHYQLEGAIHLLGTDFKRFHVDIASNFLFSLSHALQLAKPFAPTIDAYGYIEMASLKSKGELNLEKLSQLEQADLPITSLKLNLKRVSFAEKAKGLVVKPIDGSLSLSVAPSLAGVGHQLDTYSNFQFEGRALLQSFLLGQREFRTTMRSEGFEQLRQRVIAAYHLKPLRMDGFLERHLQN